MKIKTIIFAESARTMQVTFVKEHWWSKWHIIEIGGSEGTPISIYNKDVTVIKQIR